MSDIAFGANRESAVLLRAALFVLLYPISVTESGIRKRNCGDTEATATVLQSGEGFVSANRAKRCIWRKIRRSSRHVRPRLPKRRALPKRQGPLLPFAQAAARRPRRLFCRKTFRRLARRLSTVLRVGSQASAARDGFTSAHEKIGKSGVLSVDGPRGNLSGRRKRRSAKSRRCEAGRPVGELPSGGGMSSEDAFRRPDGRRTAGEFCRNTQVKREVVHLSTRLSTMPAFYAVKKPQKRVGKERSGKGEFPRKRALI